MFKLMRRCLDKSGKDESNNKPAFQSRKTIADYIKDNMNAKNRKSFYQRLIAITQHKEDSDTFINLIRKKFTEIIDKCNSNVNCERICGIYLYYQGNSIFLIEGSEDVLGIFLQELHKSENTLFEIIKVLIFINNIGNTYFNNFIWRTYEPSLSTESIEDNNSENNFEIIQNDVLPKLERLFIALGTEFGRKTILPDIETVLSQNYVKIIPDIDAIKFLLKSEQLFNINDYAICFQKLPAHVDYDCVVWPIPFDHTPLDVFKTGKYDVNLTFKGTN